MRRMLSRRPSPAMIVAVIALFAALGGTGYAASQISGKNIKNRSIAAKKLKKHTLTTTEIADSLANQMFRAGVANGVGNEAGCASGQLAIVTRNGVGNAVDHRFSFQVPGGSPAFGQIRADGSVRQSSANVSGVTHTAGTGVYCVKFSVSITQAAIESSVAAPHDTP